MATVEVGGQTGGVADVIDTYVSNVALRLRGSARLRADMLTEIRDALTDAAEAHEADGAADGEAQRRAVAEFGPARQIAAGLQDELALAHGRRTAGTLLVVLTAQAVAMGFLGRSGEWQRLWADHAPSAAYLWLAQAVDVFNLVALAAAAAGVVGFRWGLRYVYVGREAARLAAVLTWIVVGVTLLSGVLLSMLTPRVDISGAMTSAVFWAMPFGAVLFSSHRCWRAAHSPRTLP